LRALTFGGKAATTFTMFTVLLSPVDGGRRRWIASSWSALALAACSGPTSERVSGGGVDSANSTVVTPAGTEQAGPSPTTASGNPRGEASTPTTGEVPAGSAPLTQPSQDLQPSQDPQPSQDQDIAAAAETGQASLQPPPKLDCDQIWLNNSGVPSDYPPIYGRLLSAEQQEAELARVLALTNTPLDAYRIETEPLTGLIWNLSLEVGAEGITVFPEVIDKTTVPPAFGAFLDEWSVLLGVDSRTLPVDPDRLRSEVLVPGGPVLSHMRLTESYCGRPVASSDPRVYGDCQVHVVGRTLEGIRLRMAPIRPVYGNAALTPEQLIPTFIGLQIDYLCATGTVTETFTETWFATFPEQTSVYVRPVEGDDMALEYRTAFHVTVGPSPNPTDFAIDVDAIDGTILDAYARFTCD